jgi:hypothetical protein
MYYTDYYSKQSIWDTYVVVVCIESPSQSILYKPYACLEKPSA